MPVITGSLAALAAGKLALGGLVGGKLALGTAGLAGAAGTAGSTFAAMGPAGPMMVGGLARAIPALLARKSPVRHYIVYKVICFTHTILFPIAFLTFDFYNISNIEIHRLLGRLHMNLLRGQTNAREDTSKSSINNQDQEVEEQVEDVVVDGGAEADAHHNIEFEI